METHDPVVERDALTRLQLAASLLAAAPDLTEVLDVVLRQAIEATGAARAAVILREGATARIAATVGVERDRVERFATMSVDDSLPVTDTIRDGSPRWLSSVAERDAAYPVLAAFADVATSYATLPLRSSGGVLGALSLTFPREHVFVEAEQQFLQALADQCAVAVDRAALAELRFQRVLDVMVDSVLFVRPVAGALVLAHANAASVDLAGRRLPELVGRDLHTIFPGLAESRFQQGYEHVLRTGLPWTASDVPYDDLLDGRRVEGWFDVQIVRFRDGLLVTSRNVTERHRIRLDLERTLAELDDAQRLAGIGSYRWDVVHDVWEWSPELYRIMGYDPATTKPTLTAFLEAKHPDDRARAIRNTTQSMLTGTPFRWEHRLVRPDGTERTVVAVGEVDVSAEGEPLLVRGTLHDVTDARAEDERRRRGEEELRREREAVDALQAAVIPVALPMHSGVRFATRYITPSPGRPVGGDWFDAFWLAGGAIGLAIGDVTGHGLEAASLMGRLANATRAHLVECADPAEALVRLNRLACLHDLRACGSALVAVLEPASGEFRWARAGHVPPVLAAADGMVRVLETPGGPLLGCVDDATFPVSETVLHSGDALLLYTDGLVERRREVIDAGLLRLVDAASASHADLERWCDRIIASSRGDEDATDDVCLLALGIG